MGNKPDRYLFTPGSFTERLTNHRKVAYYPYDRRCSQSGGNPKHVCWALVPFVFDELLVDESLITTKDPIYDAFKVELNKLAQTTNASVFHGLGGIAKDTQIWKLNDARGHQKNADVAEAVWKLRSLLPGRTNAERRKLGRVAPNHILISPGNMHECPFGPPEEHFNAVPLPRQAGAGPEVVMIDSGYIRLGPIQRFLTGRVVFAEWLERSTSPAGALQYVWRPGVESPVGRSARLDQNGDGLLDALAGHANFVAGVAAQGCESVKLTVVSHGAAFLDLDTVTNPAFVTEAAVARSLWKHHGAPVINVGFAFPTLPNAAVTSVQDTTASNEGPPSWTLQKVLDAIFDEEEEHLIVAPAGNHGCCVPQYPAAFSLQYDNVIGVGSVSAAGTRSDFSDHGPWVSCCTEGENVVSTFITGWDSKPTEEPEEDGPLAGQRPPKYFESGFAGWSGTCFAAPKVSAALACDIAAGATPQQAWANLIAGRPQPAALEMGYLLDGLAPY